MLSRITIPWVFKSIETAASLVALVSMLIYSRQDNETMCYGTSILPAVFHLMAYRGSITVAGFFVDSYAIFARPDQVYGPITQAGEEETIRYDSNLRTLRMLLKNVLPYALAVLWVFTRFGDVCADFHLSKLKKPEHLQPA
ncbi:hypothetical protein B0J14DRAFT_651578 [Halenospora varia]|nr:hypothetical protein B0J14DRAFT_651578 [Halenospora varia]